MKNRENVRMRETLGQDYFFLLGKYLRKSLLTTAAVGFRLLSKVSRFYFANGSASGKSSTLGSTRKTLVQSSLYRSLIERRAARLLFAI